MFNIKKMFHCYLMTFLGIWITICYAQTQTSLNSCANEKKVFKLDIRQRVQSGGTIEDIDAYALCQEAYQYDYIWLYQLCSSLGLYQSVIQYYYPNEINEQGIQLYMKDFYENIKLHSMATDLYFMGGEDNSQYKSKLLNYLQIIYNQPTPDNNWINTNYTLSNQYYVDMIDKKSAKAQINNQFTADVDQTMSPTKNTCVRYNYTNYNLGGAGIILSGRGLYVILSGYTQDLLSMVYDYNQGGSDPKRNSSFFFGNKDIIEVQFEPQQYLIRYKKLFQENNQQASTYMERQSDYTKIKFTGSVVSPSSIIQIAFPFIFSSQYKHSNCAIMGHRHIKLSVSNGTYYMAQVEPSINQKEQNFTLNFYILYLTPGQWVGVGVCDRDRIQFNGHRQWPQLQGLGVYQLFTNGKTWHNATGEASTSKTYGQYDLISVTYLQSNKSILFYKNQTYQTSFNLVDTVKNLNFCVSMVGQDTTVYLEY